MAITQGRANTCTTGLCSGGAGTLYLANANEVSSVTTNASGAATAITLTSTAANFFEFEFRDFSAAFTETGTVDPVTKAKSVEQTFTGIWTCRNQADRNIIEELASSSCGLVAVHVENTGRYWVWGNIQVGGKTLSATLTGFEGQSGTAITDPNQETLTLTCSTTKKAIELMDGATIMGALI